MRQSIKFLMYISKSSSQLTLRELDFLLSIAIGQYAKCNQAMGTYGKSLSHLQISHTEVL